MTQTNKIVAYLVRHGQTDYNLSRTATGQIDCPINTTGRQQASALRDTIAQLVTAPSHIIHSGLARARETADIINEHLALPSCAMSAFQEIHYGDWQGVEMATVTEKQPDYPAGPPNGEPYVIFEERVAAGLVTAATHFSRPIIVCHAGAIQAVFGKLGFKLPRIENAVLYELTGGFTDQTESNFANYTLEKLSLEEGRVIRTRLMPERATAPRIY